MTAAASLSFSCSNPLLLPRDRRAEGGADGGSTATILRRGRSSISTDLGGAFLQSFTDAVNARHIILAGGTPWTPHQRIHANVRGQ
jgi:hypothetical protein